MSATLQFDEDASRRVERIYTTPDVIQQRQTILRALALQPGERAIDIGSGPGLLACENGRCCRGRRADLRGGRQREHA
jgi:precorrin-6B methylase 2